MNREEFLRAGALACLGMIGGGWPGPPPLQAGQLSVPFRVGFHRGLFTDLPEADARAAVMAWGMAVARERGIEVDPSTQLFDHPQEIVNALRHGSVDSVSAGFPEYAVIAAQVPTGPWFLTQTSGALFEEYVLLAHAQAGHGSLAALQGALLLLHGSARMSLARDWLDLLVMGSGQIGGAQAFFGEVRQVKKASGAALPVFFGQADACVVTQSAFDTLCELNPQLGRSLVVLDRSRPLVPAVMFFRSTYDSPDKASLITALNELHRTPAGQQVLALFQSEALVQVDEKPLKETQAFLAEVRSLRAGRGGTEMVPPTTSKQGIATS